MSSIKINKKGMSSIIQVSILAALSILALSMVWGYVSDLSNGLGSRLSPAVDCIQQLPIINACINTEGKIEVNLEVALGDSINKIDLSLNQESFSCGDSSCQSCIIGGTENRKTIYLNPTIPAQVSHELAVSINSCSPELIPLKTC